VLTLAVALLPAALVLLMLLLFLQQRPSVAEPDAAVVTVPGAAVPPKAPVGAFTELKAAADGQRVCPAAPLVRMRDGQSQTVFSRNKRPGLQPERASKPDKHQHTRYYRTGNNTRARIPDKQATLHHTSAVGRVRAACLQHNHQQGWIPWT
jgi:hypothetical protein